MRVVFHMAWRTLHLPAIRAAPSDCLFSACWPFLHTPIAGPEPAATDLAGAARRGRVQDAAAGED